MHQLCRILLSFPGPPYCRHGTPAVFFGKIVAVLAQWTTRWTRPMSSTFFDHLSLPPGTPTSPLRPTPTTLSQVDTQVYVTLTLASIFVCVILIIGTFCLYPNTWPRPSGRPTEDSPTLLETLVQASDSLPPPFSSPISCLRRVGLLGLKLTSGRFQLPFFSRKSLLLWPWRWQQFCVNLLSTFLNVTQLTLGWVLLLSKASSTSSRSVLRMAKLALGPFRMPCMPALLISCFKRMQSVVGLCSNLVATVFDIAESTLGRFRTLVIVPHAQPIRVTSYSLMMHLFRRYRGEHLRLLVHTMIVFMIAIYLLLGYLPSLFAQVAIDSVTHIVGLYVLQGLLVVLFVVFECELINRLAIFPNRHMAVYHRLHFRANGQVGRNVHYTTVGVTDVRTVTFVGFVFCAVVAILREAVDRVFPVFGCEVVLLAAVMMAVIRMGHIACTWTHKDMFLPLELPLEVIFDPHLPVFGPLLLEFVIDDRDDRPDEANNDEGAGGTLAVITCFHKYRVIQECGGSNDRPKGIG
ncbi:hypothetical protein FPV67DRAFT_1529471 [Lyophyllum atratum]|nr:hypothetical protein FPV67DRAFT_1529471 [Lyophyllum atratum]